MKKYLLIFSVVLLPSLGFAAAQLPVAPADTIDGVIGIACNILNYVFGILMVVALVFVLVAAFYYLTSSGEPEQVKKANKTLTWAAVAIVIAIFARGFPSIVASVVNGGLQSGCTAPPIQAQYNNLYQYSPNLAAPAPPQRSLPAPTGPGLRVPGSSNL